jgi:hypothetical protein
VTEEKEIDRLIQGSKKLKEKVRKYYVSLSIKVPSQSFRMPKQQNVVWLPS